MRPEDKRTRTVTAGKNAFRARAVRPAPLYATALICLFFIIISHRARVCKDILKLLCAYLRYMALIFIRTAVIFLTLLVCMRLMGKSQIGEMQPFEFVITLLIAELACIPMADSSIPLMYGIVSVVTIFILHQAVWLLDMWFRPMKRVICGKPSLVITKDGVDMSQLKKNNLDVSDLIESMRAAGYFNLDDVYYGLYEANGSFSALPREEMCGSLPVLIIDDGKPDRENMRIAGISEEKLKNFLSGENTKLKQVAVMTVDGNGRVYFQPKGKRYSIRSIETEGKW